MVLPTNAIRECWPGSMRLTAKIPKIYTLTMILSLSLPKAQGSKPSRVYSLPTIRFSEPPQASTSPTAEEPRAARKRYNSTPEPPGKWSSVVRQSWRRSQDLLKWSLLPTDGHEPIIDNDKFAYDKTILAFPRPLSAPQERRGSLAPLLDTEGTPRYTTTNGVTYSPLTRSLTLPETEPPDQHSVTRSAETIFAGPRQTSFPSPPPIGMIVNRQHSLSTMTSTAIARPDLTRRSTVPGQLVQPSSATAQTTVVFDNPDPFNHSVGVASDERGWPRRPLRQDRQLSFSDMLEDR